MKTRIKKLISIKGIPVLTLALLAGVVLMTGIVWAQSTEDSVNCAFEYAGTHTAKQWIDEEGVLHLRGITYWLLSDGDSGNIEIEIAGVCNHNYDLGTGDGDFWGDDETVDVTWGDLTGTFRGRHSGTRTNHTVGDSNHIYQGIDGDFRIGLIVLQNQVVARGDGRDGRLLDSVVVLHGPHRQAVGDDHAIESQLLAEQPGHNLPRDGRRNFAVGLQRRVVAMVGANDGSETTANQGRERF